MQALPLGVGWGDLRARFAQPKLQLAEQSLALTDSQCQPIAPPQKLGQAFPIPQVDAQTGFLGWLS